MSICVFNTLHRFKSLSEMVEVTSDFRLMMESTFLCNFQFDFSLMIRSIVAEG